MIATRSAVKVERGCGVLVLRSIHPPEMKLDDRGNSGAAAIQMPASAAGIFFE